MNNTANTFEAKRQNALRNAKLAADARDEAIRRLRATPPRRDTMYVPAPWEGDDARDDFGMGEEFNRYES